MHRAATRQTTLIATLVASAAAAQAGVGGTVSLQSDARERGISYSGNQPNAQLGLAWDGLAGWYVGARLAPVRFDGQCCGAALQSYGGRVFELAPDLDAEAGLIAHHHTRISRYDFREVYVGLLGDGWSARLYHSPDYYGSRQRTVYAELNGRWPVMQGLAVVAHLGYLRGSGPEILLNGGPRGASRVDGRIGASWPVGVGSELQLSAVTAGRGGPTTWTDNTRRSAAVLGLSTAF